MAQFALPRLRALSCWVSQAPPNLRAVPIGKQRMAFDDNGAVHRFMDNNTVEGWHWAGASSDVSAPFKPSDTQKSALIKAFPSQKRNRILK